MQSVSLFCFTLLKNCYFCPMKRIGKRISYVDNKENTTIVIHPENIGWKNSLLLAWLTVWLFVGVYVCYEITQDYSREIKLTLVIFMSFWLYFAYKVGKAVLWQFYGKELIKIDGIHLTYKKSILSYGKAKSFFLDNIHKLRTEEIKNTSLRYQFESSIWVVGGERLSFDNMGKSHFFGRKLDEQDANLLFKLISKRLNDFIKKAKKTQPK